MTCAHRGRGTMLFPEDAGPLMDLPLKTKPKKSPQLLTAAQIMGRWKGSQAETDVLLHHLCYSCGKALKPENPNSLCQARGEGLNLSNFLEFLFFLDNISSPPGAGEPAPGAVASLSQPSTTFTFLSTSPIRAWITNHSTVATGRALHLSNKQGKAFLARRCLSEDRQHPTMHSMSVQNMAHPSHKGCLWSSLGG